MLKNGFATTSWISMNICRLANAPIGTEIYRFRGVPVFENGSDKDRSHGRHFSRDQAYYYGQKWQCVEFVKRFYDLALNHRMPDVWGHARDFFDERLENGRVNERRGLLQFRNRGDICPEVHDILVFSDTRYGHLAIVSQVFQNSLQVVQQNIIGKPVESFELDRDEGRFFVHSPRIPDGWLRIESGVVNAGRNASK